MPGYEAGLNLLGILERLSNVLIKANADGGNQLTADKDLISLGGSEIEKSYFCEMESVFYSGKDHDAIKTATAIVYKSITKRESLRVIFHVNDETFFQYNVNSVERKRESGGFQHANISEFIALLCNGSSSSSSTTWKVSNVKNLSTDIQLTIQINITTGSTREVYMNLKCNSMES